MDCEYFLDSSRLQAHASDLMDGKYTAQRLQNELQRAMNYADPSFSYRFNRLITKAENLSTFFRRLSDVLDETSYEAEVVILKIQSMLEESKLDPDSIIQIDSDHI